VSVRSWLTPTLLVATLVLAGCAAGDGLRVEDGHQPAAGQATTSPAPPTETPTRSKSSNGIMRDSETPHIDGERSGSGPAALSVRELRALLLTDSAVDADAKAVLRTCEQCLARGVATDVIGTGVPQRIVTVKVLNTGWTFVAYLVGDVGGLPKVRSTIRGQDMRITAGKNGSLVVGSKVYGPTDRSCCPSGSKVEVYRWNGNYLVKKSEVFTKGS
jgi:hypothetical protein